MNRSQAWQTAIGSLAVSLGLLILLVVLRPGAAAAVSAACRSMIGDDFAGESRLRAPVADAPRVAGETRRSTRSGERGYLSVPSIAPPASRMLEQGPRIEPVEIEPGAIETASPSGRDGLKSPSHVDDRLAALQRAIEQLAQVESDRQANEAERAGRQLEQIQQSRRLRELEQQLERLRSGGPAFPPPSTVAATREADAAAASSTDGERAATTETAARNVDAESPQPHAGADDGAGPRDAPRFSLQVRNAEITEVLDMLGGMTGHNILIGTGVGGTVPSANLRDVTLAEALDVIVRSLGLEYEQNGHFIFVMTAAEHETRHTARRTSTRPHEQAKGQTSK